MANFQQHLWYGAGVSAVCALVGYIQLDLTKVQCIAAGIIGTLAGLAPDLDHPRGVPGKMLAEIMGALVPIAFLLYLPIEYVINFKLEHWIVLFFATQISVRHFLLFFLDKTTTHRGIFHSFPASVICGQCIFLAFAHLPLSNRLTIAITGILGYLTHLIADEFYSIEWDKIEAKRSLGSALDLGNLKNFSTWIAYALMVVLGCVIWYQLDPENSIFSFLSLSIHMPQ